MHFIRNPHKELHSSKLVLTNLRCPTFRDFRWYKDVFTTHIFQRQDCNASFWKERFIAGLPKFFSNRVLKKLAEITEGNSIPWDTITYGQLFAFVKKEGLALCQEQKNKRNSEKYSFKQTIGNFCIQYGYNNLTAPSPRKPQRSKSITYPSRDKKKKAQFNEPYYKRDKKRSKPNRKSVVCWTYKKPGHTSTNCKVKNKINEIFKDR